ncbi:hypothetical protein PW52_03680 [Tamlana sedimentorum]|uniref:Uncharacterized protein n=1 Tax=Neotamlana sedimentorum TaxID=1435349 RepID=A0A0D7WDJ0_9FLAO|nr:hypothetical protein [Tamlana sedimentorum]KJD36748.1 hypothetical protein PW52_03680 [Tamlana sedimentorum]
MSKDLQPSSQKSEEVDLGLLFNVIGSVFNRFIKFIEKVFKLIYNLLLILLFHIYKRFLWYVGAALIGAVVGFIIDMNSEQIYGANMYIETNFKSSRQVYENIKQFNQLASEDKDSLELAKVLKISVKDASKLKGFYIEPDLDENNIAKMYSDFYKNLDSVSRDETNYEKYKESLTPHNFNVHRIGVASSDKHLYTKIEKAFTKELTNNSYLYDLLHVSNENLDNEDLTLQTQVKKTDSLVAEYLTIRMNESKRQTASGSNTNLYMGNAEANNLIVDETKLIDKRLDLEARRRFVNTNKVEQQDVINVLAGFPKTGYDISVWHQKMKFVLPLIIFGLTFLFFLLFGLKKYLDSESKNLSLK